MARFLILEDIQGRPIGCWDNVLNQPCPMGLCTQPWTNLTAPPTRKPKNPSTKYSYYQQTRYNGVNKFYGVNVLGDKQEATELNGVEFYKLTLAPLMLRDGSEIYKAKLSTGNSLIAITERIGNGMKLPRRVIAQYIKLLPARSTMLMALAAKKIPVANENDIYEISLKYARIHPDTRPKISEAKYKRAFQAEKSGVDGFDFTGIFQAVGSLVGGIIDAVSAGNVAQQIKDFTKQYKIYMDTDLGAIQTTYNATKEAPGPWSGYGALGALAMLWQYKRTSWAELKAHINDLAQKAGQEVPQPIKDFWAEQDRLEQTFKQKIAADYQAGADPGGQILSAVPKVSASELDPRSIYNSLQGYSGSGSGGSGSGGSGNGNQPGAKFDFMQFINENMTMIIIAIAVILLLLFIGKRK